MLKKGEAEAIVERYPLTELPTRLSSAGPTSAVVLELWPSMVPLLNEYAPSSEE